MDALYKIKSQCIKSRKTPYNTPIVVHSVLIKKKTLFALNIYLDYIHTFCFR